MYTGIGDAVGVGIGVLALLVPTILINIPLIAICVIARKRLGPRRSAWLVGVGFVAACVWWMRGASHEPIATAAHLALVYVPSVVAIGWIGWFLGRLIGRNFELSVPQSPDDFTRLTR
jgi:hypothetical protein